MNRTQGFRRGRTACRASGLLLLENTARLVGAGWIDCRPTFLDVTYDATFVHHERRAGAISRCFIVKTVVLRGFALPVAEQREQYAYILGKALIRRKTIHTNSQHLSFG